MRTAAKACSSNSMRLPSPAGAGSPVWWTQISPAELNAGSRHRALVDDIGPPPGWLVHTLRTCIEMGMSCGYGA